MCMSTVGQEATARGGTLATKVLGDRILVRIHMRTAAFQKETHAVIDLANSIPLQVNRNVFPAIRYGEGETTLKLVNEAFQIEVDQAAIQQEAGGTTFELTSNYDNELEQVDVALIAGWPLLRDFAIRFDPLNSELELIDPTQMSREWAQQNAQLVVDGVRLIDETVLVPVNKAEKSSFFLKLATDGYHTFVDSAHGGDADIFWGTGSSESISLMTALFPQDLSELQPEASDTTILLASGLNLLTGYQLYLNHHAGFLALTRVVDSNHSSADAQFYQAASAEGSEGLQQFLADNGEDRNVKEAVAMLFEMQLKDSPTPEGMLSLLDYGLAVTEERRKFRYMLEYFFQLVNTDPEQLADVIIAVGDRALEFVGRAQEPMYRQQVQLAIGDRYLDRKQPNKAMRYILAAAFNGHPDLDGVVRHELGRVYEAQGRVRRAYSNYHRSLSEFVQLPPNLQESAQTALERLRPQLDPDDELLANTANAND